MIPWGPWRPDAAGINTPVLIEARNVLPSVKGYLPLLAPATSSEGLPTECRGAVTVRLPDGSVKSYAGDTENLWRLDNDATWELISDVSGYDTLVQSNGTDGITTAGGDDIAFPGIAYSTSGGERWNFEVFGDNLIATNFTNNVQKIDVTTASRAEDLGGSPPKARYIAVVRDFVVLAGLENAERKLHWSAINDAEGWTPGTDNSDTQEFPSGGPIRGIVGGETGYIWQPDRVHRMTFVPGSDAIFNFDEVEGGRGLSAPASLVKWGGMVYYLGPDGFYKFSLGGGASEQIGAGKWRRWFLDDIRAGTELEVLGGVSPNNRAIVWAYISRENSGTVPNRLLIYDWILDEATFADIDCEAIAQWLTQGYTLDTMNAFGDLDNLPYSLDAPFWRGGQGLIAIFDTTHAVTHLQGLPMEARFTTADAMGPSRVLIQGTRPHIDARDIRVEIAAREGDGDTITYSHEESREDTGEVPAHVSGNYIRARVTVPASQTWSRATGLETLVRKRGRR